MSMSVDTLIANLASQANSYNNAAYSYTTTAKNQVAGESQSISLRKQDYIAPPATKDVLTITLAEDRTTKEIVDDLKQKLNHYFDTFFPDVSDQYDVWIDKIKRAVERGVPLTLDNLEANRQAQDIDAGAGKRAQRTIRAGWASKGYSLPPGGLVGMVMDETDVRTEKLIAGAIGSANKATNAVVSAYKAVLSAAASTEEARISAINAMSNLIKTAAAIYSTETDAKVALYRERTAAAEAAMAYYAAETRLDGINTNLYKQNIQLEVQRFEADGKLFQRNEAAQAQAAIASAEEAGKIAQAAFSSLNTIVSSSTAGFA